MHNINAMPGYIPIGNQRDFGHTIQFDLTAWADLNADNWVITYMRPGESATYPVPDGDVSVADNVLTWTISEAVTAINGAGSVVIEAYRGGEMLKHSDRIMTIIGEGHEPAGEAPDPVADWIEDATSKLAEVDPALGLAADATLAAKTAAGRADTIAGTLEGIAPKWAAVDISASGLAAGADPTASVTQDETGTSISLGIPKGDTGAQGPQGPQGMTGPSAYDAAVAGGYTGTEEQFNTAMGDLPGATQAAQEAAIDANLAADSIVDFVVTNVIYRSNSEVVSGARQFVTKVMLFPITKKNTYYTMRIKTITGSTASLPLLLQAWSASSANTTDPVYSKSFKYSDASASIYADENTSYIRVTLYGSTNYLVGEAVFTDLLLFTGTPQDGEQRLLVGGDAEKITGSAQARWKPSIIIPTYSHRGFQLTAPMCTASACIEARKRGYEGCENDVKLSFDGEFVMWHDQHLGRLGVNLKDINGYVLYLDGAGNPFWHDEDGGQLYTFDDETYTESEVDIGTLTKSIANTFSVSSFPLSTLKRIDFGRWKSLFYKGEQILTFKEWVLLCHRLGLKIIVDIKTPITGGQATEMAEIVKNAGMQRHTTWNIDGAYSAEIRAVDPLARLQFLAPPTPERCDLLAPLLSSGGPGSVSLCPQSIQLTELNSEMAHEYGFDLSCWIVDYEGNQYPDGFVESEILRVSDLGIGSIVLDEFRAIDVVNIYYKI